MGNGLIYESLMCKAYKCERGGNHGTADADVYRRMERGCRKAEIDEDDYEARVQISKVSSNVSGALSELVKEYPEQQGQLRSLQSNLGLNHDRQVLDNVISEAWSIVKDS